jgi:hypothetical protein
MSCAEHATTGPFFTPEWSYFSSDESWEREVGGSARGKFVLGLSDLGSVSRLVIE